MTKKNNHKPVDICANCKTCLETDDDEVVKCDNENSEHYQHFVSYTHYSCKLFEMK